MTGRKILVAIFDAKTDVEEALRQLAAAEVELASVSVVGRSHHVEEQLCGWFRARCGTVRYVGRGEGFWNRLWGQLPGAAFFWVPGVGPLVFAGALSGDVIEHAEAELLRGDVDANPLRAALLSLGVPGEVAATCESALRGDRLLLLARTPGCQATRTFALLEQSRSLETRAYPDAAAKPATAAADGAEAVARRRDASAV